MFDTPSNRFIYEDAITRHDELMESDTIHGKSYRLGHMGKSYSDNPTISYEYWQAGRHNSKLTNKPT